MAPQQTRFSVPVPPRTSLWRLVCSYGYFLLAPNHWDPRSQSLRRPLQVGGRVVWVTLSQKAAGGRLAVACDGVLHRQQSADVRSQVARMLRLGDDLSGFWRLHPRARRAGFGRLFRSPTLFEDMVKTITSCNVTWPNTMRMNRLLCDAAGAGAFPTAEQLARWTPRELAAMCKVGYRAQRIIRLARRVAAGKLDLNWFEDPARSSQELYEAMLKVDGFGPYSAANLLQLLGRYDRLAIDTEACRYFCQSNARARPATPGSQRRLEQLIRRHYERFAPYQFLAFWLDIWRGYERHAGPSRFWLAGEHGRLFTAATLRRTRAELASPTC